MMESGLVKRIRYAGLLEIRRMFCCLRYYHGGRDVIRVCTTQGVS